MSRKGGNPEMKKRIYEIAAVAIGAVSMVATLGSFLFWHEPKAPKA
jgi:cyclic lactone autoinducer peptide